MNHNQQKEGLSNLFIAWIGMADRNDMFIDSTYHDLNLDSPDQLSFILKKDVIPHLENLKESKANIHSYSKKHRENYEQTIDKQIQSIKDFLEFSIEHPNDINIESIFDSMLVTIKPPTEKQKFFEIIYERCKGII